MKYLTRPTTKGVHQFTSGATTTDHDAATFFLIMEEKGVSPAEIASYIRIGANAEPGQHWTEIKRIAATFTAAKGEAA